MTIGRRGTLGPGGRRGHRRARLRPGEPRLRRSSSRRARSGFDRRSNPHVGFGNGPHTCIGLQLARLEAQAFLRVLLAEVPDWHLLPGARMEVAEIEGSVVPVRFDALPIATG